MQPEQDPPLDAFIDAVARALGLALEPAWKPAIRANLEVNLRLAALVAELDLRRDRLLEEERTTKPTAPAMLLTYAGLAIIATALLFWRLFRALRKAEEAEAEIQRRMEQLDREVRTREFAERSLKRVLDSSPSGIMAFRSVRDGRGLIVDFEWKELFWRRRAELAARARFFAFGHALYEKAVEPYLGIVAKTVFVPFAADAGAADRLLARHFSDRANFPRPKAMAPMPVLGVPGWHPDTSREAFYDDPSHFRSK